MTLVGFLGLGEAGSLIAADLAATGVLDGSREHAVRRRAEMEAAVAMLEELGVAPRVAAASEAWLGALADARRESVA